MRTTLTLNDELLTKAHTFTGIKENSALVREALTALMNVKVRVVWRVWVEASRCLKRLPDGDLNPHDSRRYIAVDQRRVSLDPR